MSNLPAVRSVQVAHRDPLQVGKTLAQSGYFQDAAQAAQAAVKVMAGEELGLGPIAAMTGIHIVKGKVTLSANLIAGLIKRSGRYDFRVEMDAESCSITFFQSGERIGVSTFTKADAQAAGLWGQNGPWKQHPRNMLYARAMSNGAKWYCPDVFAGSVYTPEEFGVLIDGATGEVLEPEVAHPPVPAVDTIVLARELVDLSGDADAFKEAMADAGIGHADLEDPETYERAKQIARGISAPVPREVSDEFLISESQRKRLFAIAREAGASDEWVKSIVLDLTGQDSRSKIPVSKYEAIIEVIQAGPAADHVAAGGEALFPVGAGDSADPDAGGKS